VNTELCRSGAPTSHETAWEVFVTAILLTASQAFARKPNWLHIRINKRIVSRCHMNFRWRHSGAMPTGPDSGRPDDGLRIEPGIQGFPDVQLHI
jgi:hypothetical protein